MSQGSPSKDNQSVGTAKPLHQLGQEIEANLEDGENGVQVKVYKYPKLPKQGQLPATGAMPGIPATAESARPQNLPSVKKGKKKSPRRNKNGEENAVYMPEKFNMNDSDHYTASNYILNGPAGRVGLVVPGQKKQRNKSNMKSRKN